MKHNKIGYFIGSILVGLVCFFASPAGTIKKAITADAIKATLGRNVNLEKSVTAYDSVASRRLSPKDSEIKNAYLLRWIDWFKTSESWCEGRYSQCAQDCLGRATNVTKEDLGGACASLSTPADKYSFYNIACHAKEFLCRYGQCDDDRHCYNDAFNHSSSPLCKDRHQIEKVATYLSCNFPIHNQDPDGTPPYYDTEDPNADLQCKPTGFSSTGWWEDELTNPVGKYTDVANFLLSLNLSTMFQKEFGVSPFGGNLGEYFPQVACLMGCWVSPYVPTDCFCPKGTQWDNGRNCCVNNGECLIR